MKPSAMNTAMHLYEQMRADGKSKIQADQALESHLRATMTHAQEWHYLCAICDDTGAEILHCAAIRCERRREHGPHSWMRPCVCRAAERWLGKPKTATDALAEAAKTSRPMKKIGH